MRKTLEFKFPFYRFASLDFYNCYASVYLFLQSTTVDNVDYACQAMEGKGCNDCWKCADSLQEKSERLHKLFETVFDGRWTTQRKSWSGKPTKIQNEIAGRYNNFESKTADEVEFLAGFTGYSYEKITDGFKENIISSIDAGKPVIAKVKNEETFRVIVGYDNDLLIDPDYRPADKPPAPDSPTTYSDIECIYVFGAKIPQRYTFRDVLQTMENVMGSDFAEGIWYDIKHNVFSGDICDLTVGEVKERFKRFRNLMGRIPNLGHSIRLPFGDKELLKQLGVDVSQHREFFDVLREQGHLLHERGYMLTAISSSIIDLQLNDSDNFPWDKLGLVNAAEQILESVIECDLKILFAIKKAIRATL